MILPRHNLMDTVYTLKPVVENPPVRGFLYRIFWKCPHTEQTEFLHIDHRDGPGSWATNYIGVVCCACRTVIRRARQDDLGWSERERWDPIIHRMHERHGKLKPVEA